jgi:putative flippase GtrA
MKIRVKSLRNKIFKKSMLRWSAVGILTNAIDYVLFIFLYGAIDSVFLANLISASLATFINYFSHHRWSFRSNQTYSNSGTKYVINLIFWWLVSTSIIKSLVVLNVDPKIAKLVPFLLIVPINYFVLNYIVFKKKT